MSDQTQQNQDFAGMQRIDFSNAVVTGLGASMVGAPDYSLQFNNGAGDFAGDPALTWDVGTKRLLIGEPNVDTGFISFAENGDVSTTTLRRAKTVTGFGTIELPNTHNPLINHVLAVTLSSLGTVETDWVPVTNLVEPPLLFPANDSNEPTYSCIDFVNSGMSIDSSGFVTFLSNSTDACTMIPGITVVKNLGVQSSVVSVGGGVVVASYEVFDLAGASLGFSYLYDLP